MTLAAEVARELRPPAAAGRFYPHDAAELAAAVDRLLARAHPALPPGELRALVAPHAGYVYSGAIAAAAFGTLPPRAPSLRVSLLGPAHYVVVGSATVSDAAGWRTPLGDVRVDDELRSVALGAGAVADPEPHREDHALEVELPFLQRRAGPGLSILPVAVGGGAEETARLVGALADGSLIVVSTDLSHYLDDAAARSRDRRTAAAVVALDAGSIRHGDACGAAALRGLLVQAKRAGWHCTLLALGTSADAAGDRSRVVGYGAFAFTAPRSRRGEAQAFRARAAGSRSR